MGAQGYLSCMLHPLPTTLVCGGWGSGCACVSVLCVHACMHVCVCVCVCVREGGRVCEREGEREGV